MNTMMGDGEFKVQPPLAKQLIGVLLVAVAVLMIPLVAMQFTSEVVWELEDFVAAGMLLVITGLLYVLVTRKAKTPRQRLIFTAALAFFFLYMWAEMAVGIFTNLGS